MSADDTAVDDPTLAELETAMVDADLRLARALELEAEAWDHMQAVRYTVAHALGESQRARERYRVLRVNARPPT